MLHTPFSLMLRKKQKHFKWPWLQYTKNSSKRHSKSDLSIIHKLLMSPLERIRLDSEVKCQKFRNLQRYHQNHQLKKCVATLQQY